MIFKFGIILHIWIISYCTTVFKLYGYYWVVILAFWSIFYAFYLSFPSSLYKLLGSRTHRSPKYQPGPNTPQCPCTVLLKVFCIFAPERSDWHCTYARVFFPLHYRTRISMLSHLNSIANLVRLTTTSSAYLDLLTNFIIQNGATVLKEKLHRNFVQVDF